MCVPARALLGGEGWQRGRAEKGSAPVSCAHFCPPFTASCLHCRNIFFSDVFVVVTLVKEWKGNVGCVDVSRAGGSSWGPAGGGTPGSN